MTTEEPRKPSYEGPRVNGRMEGYGKYTFSNGTVFTGQFLDGEFHGEVRRGADLFLHNRRPEARARCTSVGAGRAIHRTGFCKK